MIKVGDEVIFSSDVDPDEAYLNGSIVKVLVIDTKCDDTIFLIVFNDGLTIDVKLHELKEIGE